MERVAIESWEQLREQVRSILERINADSALAIAAAANPMLALEELGFDIRPAARDDIELRFRFRPRAAVRVRQLTDEIYRLAGRRFDLNSADELAILLFDRLGIEPSGGYKKYEGARPDIDLRPLAHVPGSTDAPKDPLEVLAGAHPIIAPLLEYRRLEASVPRLAPRSLYDAMRRGTRRVPVTRLVARLKEQP